MKRRESKSEAPIFGAFLHLQNSSLGDITRAFAAPFRLPPLFAVSYNICVFVSELTITCQRTVCLRQPHTEPVVVLFYGS